MVQTKIKDSAWPLIIAAFRADFGLTQNEMQAMLGLSPKSPIVSQWESGYRKPKQYLYAALCEHARTLRKARKRRGIVERWCRL